MPPVLKFEKLAPPPEGFPDIRESCREQILSAFALPTWVIYGYETEEAYDQALLKILANRFINK